MDHKKAIIYRSPQQTVYFGKLESHFKRLNVSPTLLVSLEDEIDLLDAQSKPIVKSKSLLIPAGVPVSLDTHHAKLAMFFLDDLGKEFSLLQKGMRPITVDGQKDFFFNSPRQQEWIEITRFIDGCRPDFTEVSKLLRQCIQPGYIADNQFDERITKVIDLIKSQSHTNVSVAELAEQVSLSVPRLIQLFKQVTGTSIRRFRLWHRIFATAEKLSKGMPLAEAAIASGFSDYAHFSRTYRELGGGNPSDARDNTEIRLLAS